MPLSSSFLHTVAGTVRAVVTQFWTRQRVKSEVSRFASSRKCSKIKGGSRCGRVAQLGEHLLCKQGVTGSIPVTSTNITCKFNRLLVRPLNSFRNLGPFGSNKKLPDP